jgi:hypothetical protein
VIAYPARIEAAIRLADAVDRCWRDKSDQPMPPGKNDRLETSDVERIAPALAEYRAAVEKGRT